MTPAPGADPEPSSVRPERGEPHGLTGGRRLHVLSGLALGVFVVYHLAALHLETVQATPRAAVDGGRAATAVLSLLVLGAILLHAVLGVRLAGRPAAPAGSARPVGWSPRAQLVTGIAALGFVALHVGTVVAPALQGAFAPSQSVAWIERLLSTSSFAVPTWGMVYVLGVCAVAAHLGHGLWGSASSFGLASSRRETSRLGWLVGLGALALGALGSETVVRVATGSAIAWPWLEPSAPAGAPAPESCGTVAAAASGAPAAVRPTAEPSASAEPSVDAGP